MTESQINHLYQRTESDLSEFIEKATPIVQAVRDQGDTAIFNFTQTFDGVDLKTSGLKVSEKEFESAIDQLDAELIQSIKYAVKNITKFHQAQMPDKMMWFEEISEGIYAGERYTPIDTVACYIPRGKASYPSTAMMVTIPAVIAGVANPVMLTPPRPDGSVDPASLFIANLVGIKNVYKVGGAQAVAAAAYGTETIPKCQKFLGPGSPWVMSAKKVVIDQLDPDISAGPSECIILADETANGHV